jgi:DNA-directed RNA polymerase II subunit RPB3
MEKSKESKTLLNLQFPFKNSWDVSSDHLTFEINNVDLSFVNSLERIILSNIPSVGFNVRPIETSQFKIFKNNTPFENEFISHRIGLIPIYLNPDNFDPAEYSFVINKENSGKSFLSVTSEDIEIIKLSDNKHLSRDLVRKIFPPHPLTGCFIPITKIIPWEDKTMDKPGFHCEGRAIVSTGLVNGAFSQVSAIAHSFKIDPEIYKHKLAEYMKEQKSEHERIEKILKEADPTYESQPFSKTPDEMKKKFDLLEAERCFYRNDDEDPYWFNMLIESIGVHSPVYILEKGLEIMIKKVAEFRELLENPVDGRLEITKGYNNMDRAYCIRIFNENETLGNLLAAHMRKYYIDNIPESEHIFSTVGFNKKHPLEKSVLFYINPAKSKKVEWAVIRNMIFEMCARVMAQAKDLIKELQANQVYKSNVRKSKTTGSISKQA